MQAWLGYICSGQAVIKPVGSAVRQAAKDRDQAAEVQAGCELARSGTACTAAVKTVTITDEHTTRKSLSVMYLADSRL